MAHKKWCGLSCVSCANPCEIDEGMPCSLDCDMLGENGEPLDVKLCLEKGCDAYNKPTEICPKCGSDEVKFGHSGLEDSAYVYHWTCADCTTSGKDSYRLVFNRVSLD